jgi:hypothetical protein
MYISGLIPGLVGVWADSGLYMNGLDQTSGKSSKSGKSAKSGQSDLSDYKPITTAGVSIRTMGIRADIGRSVRWDSPMQIHLSFDMEGFDFM